jgi:hypothetical protein
MEVIEILMELKGQLTENTAATKQVLDQLQVYSTKTDNLEKEVAAVKLQVIRDNEMLPMRMGKIAIGFVVGLGGVAGAWFAVAQLLLRFR